MANYLLVAAAALNKDDVVAAEALVTVLRLRPDFSLTWVRGNTPLIGEVAERVIRRAAESGRSGAMIFAADVVLADGRRTRKARVSVSKPAMDEVLGRRSYAAGRPRLPRCGP
jgi:hypothetical protein